MSRDAKDYRSPTKKLMRFFEGSRDRWKKKCQAAKQRAKSLHTKVADLRASRERWKKETKQLRAEVARLRSELQAQQKAISATRY